MHERLREENGGLIIANALTRDTGLGEGGTVYSHGDSNPSGPALAGALAVLRALHENGYVIVPVQPEESSSSTPDDGAAAIREVGAALVERSLSSNPSALEQELYQTALDKLVGLWRNKIIADRHLRDSVHYARQQGASWKDIADRLGMQPEMAYLRWGLVG